jgi:hypothetical protein
VETLWPYLLVVLVGFLPTEIWRALAVLLSRNIDEKAEILIWVRAVATTLLAAVVAKLLLSPAGALAPVPLSVRVLSVGLGLAGYFVLRRSPLLGVLVGEVALVAMTALAT